MDEWSVRDAVNTEIVPLQEGTPLDTVVQHFAEQDAFVYPVVSKDGKIIGVLTFDMLKELLTERDTWQWLLVGDVMKPVKDHLPGGMNLAEAIREMQNLHVEALPVVESADSGKLLGVLDLRETRRKVGIELVQRQTAAA